MRLWFRILVVCMLAVVFAGCGPTTFIISKGTRAYYLGRKSDSLYEMLCRSGDLEQILSETTMPDNLKKDLYRYTCTEERSKEKVVALYNFLSPEEKKNFQDAFRRHDYTINYVPC
ncbi:MAG: hypothetical protein M0024_10745 [Nitrospiraceae bacterium]|nr:hypothetical protein [Nitrospiraceae bacterium]